MVVLFVIVPAVPLEAIRTEVSAIGEQALHLGLQQQ